jgi:uroporphyrinogen-III synthase
MRVIVTRPRAQAEPLVAQLQRLGIDAVALPLIDIAPVSDPAPVQAAWQALDGLALLMFVSANAVQHFMRQRPQGRQWPARVLAGSTGPGTSAALREAGVPPAALVEPQGEVFDSEALWQQLRGRDWQGRRAAVVRGEDGRDWLAEQLHAAGAEVDFVAAYRRLPPRLDDAGRALLTAARAQPRQHLWAFGSSQAASHLEGLVPQADWSQSIAAAPHPRIVAAVRRLGFGAVRQLAGDAESLAAAAREGPPIQSQTP